MTLTVSNKKKTPLIWGEILVQVHLGSWYNHEVKCNQIKDQNRGGESLSYLLYMENTSTIYVVSEYV